MTKPRFEDIVWFIIENTAYILTIGFTTYVLLQSQRLNLQPLEVSLWILAIIGMLATAELIARFGRLRRIEVLTREAVETIKSREGRPKAQDILYTREESPPLRVRIGQAREVWLTGRSLVNVVDFANLFEEVALRHKCRFRFLLPDPDEVDGELVYGKPEAAHFAVSMQKTLAVLGGLHRSVGSDLVEVRVLKHIPTLGLFIINGNQPFGRIQVQLYPYRCQGFERPVFDVDADDEWYAVFREHFLELWAIACPFEFDGQKCPPLQISPGPP